MPPPRVEKPHGLQGGGELPTALNMFGVMPKACCAGQQWLAGSGGLRLQIDARHGLSFQWIRYG